jgi:hypothetical protein
MPKTSSPGWNRVTPGPMALTMPEKSEPIARGKERPVIIVRSP